jgi:hypothetical protein
MGSPRLPSGRDDRLPRPPAPTAHPAARHAAATRRGRPDASGLRAVLGLAGLASASALATAMLPSILPQQVVMTAADMAPTDPTAQPEPSVIHITRVVQLAPGQTLPPDAGANLAPAPPTATPKATPRPTPRVIIQTITRQSGKP